MRNYSAYRILCLTYTALNAKQPRYLYDIIKLKENTRRLRSSNSLLLSNQKFNLDTMVKEDLVFQRQFYGTTFLYICEDVIPSKHLRRPLKIIYYAQHEILD